MRGIDEENIAKNLDTVLNGEETAEVLAKEIEKSKKKEKIMLAFLKYTKLTREEAERIYPRAIEKLHSFTGNNRVYMQL